MYSVHPAVAYVASMIENLRERTGRDLEQWKSLAAGGPADRKTLVAWLKENHGQGGTTANLIASAALGQDPESFDGDRYLDMAVEYVRTMFSGKKEILQPLYDAVIERVLALGDGVRLCPAKTFVPVYRTHVIAQVKPSTLTRIDLGLALKGFAEPLPARLVDTGGMAKGDRITHRMGISRPEDIDSEVDRWLQVAFNLDG